MDCPRLEEGGSRASDAALARTYDQLTDTSYGMELARAPKAMADIVESLAGAVYVDAGFNLEPAFEATTPHVPTVHHGLQGMLCSVAVRDTATYTE